MFLTERKFTGLRAGITCVVYRNTASMFLPDLPLIINLERPLQSKIEIIWHCININKKISSFFIAETILFRICTRKSFSSWAI